jgi:hypothetical protein
MSGQAKGKKETIKGSHSENATNGMEGVEIWHSDKKLKQFELGSQTMLSQRLSCVMFHMNLINLIENLRD